MSGPDPDSVKMFVGQIPRTMEEDELKQMMEEYGPVYQLGIIRDRSTCQHKGKCLHVNFSPTKYDTLQLNIVCAVTSVWRIIKDCSSK